MLIETLIGLRDKGYIEAGRLHVRVSNSLNNHRKYHEAVAFRCLTRAGMLVARELEPAPATSALSTFLTIEGLDHCRRDFDRAAGAIATDPEQAIGSACALLESICRAILDRAGRPQPEDLRIQPLVNEVLPVLDLAPGSQAASHIKPALRGLASIAQQVGALRSKDGAVHGRVPDHIPLEPRHARLAVNAAATVGLFLLETALAMEIWRPR
ncbi:abortive infection family protein [Thiococcus pfennigii]|uniref:abortive infection family protein n=1 Tax=Thiococcus pfennigii TaxID=1057 RepID=UPI001A931BD6|nr:abortive infection family protein [Thiococcus pfennigii]